MNFCKRLKVSAAFATVAAGVAVMAMPCHVDAKPLSIDEMGIVVPHNDSREYSYSDKAAGFYYGQTSVDDWNDWYAGWNIRAKRIFADYRIYVDGQVLSRKNADVTVYPDRLVRDFGRACETFSLIDGQKVLYVAIDDVVGSRVGIELVGENVEEGRKDGNTVVCQAVEAPGDCVRISGLNPDVQLAFDGTIVSATPDVGGFVITYGKPDESLTLANRFVADPQARLSERKARMQALVEDNALATNSLDFDRSLLWVELTADELVTHQHGGWGIYAGFPWFTDFWGRDMFIAMPGAVLCTGQFDVARDILLSFARYQDKNPESPTYGRVPNRLNLDGILYNTTDGTPRFVMEVLDYLKYTGDTSLVGLVYESVKIATDASVRHYTDDKGYLSHDDADTWMDAKRQSKYPCSPRGNRAVDIQALWYGQLHAAADLADYMGDGRQAEKWRNVASKLRANFKHDFVDKAKGVIYDHLNSDGSGDLQLRPNTIYAHGLLDDSLLVMHDTRNMWEHLVYPWGVSTLGQYDDQFHPYHEQWYRYHKDDAYHNGTVWLWLNGMAMQRMVEYGQQDLAYELFKNMNRQALAEGAVGSLSECADAWPRAGKTWARRSGTFLQAWSNGEHIRVWSQYFLGIRPDMLKRTIDVCPKLPTEITSLDQRVCVADGGLRCIFHRYDGETTEYRYVWNGSQAVTLNVSVGCFAPFDAAMTSGSTLVINCREGHVNAVVYAKDGTARVVADALEDKQLKERRARYDAYFDGTHFAEPCYREDLKCMSRYFNPPLDYQSVE